MKNSTILTAYTVVAGLFGLGFVLIPGQLISLYGADSTPVLNFIMNLLGAHLVSLAIVAWSLRKAAESELRRAVLLALFIGEALGLLVVLRAQIANVLNALNWTTVASYLLFSIGLAYILFVKRGSSEEPFVDQ